MNNNLNFKKNTKIVVYSIVLCFLTLYLTVYSVKNNYDFAKKLSFSLSVFANNAFTIPNTKSVFENNLRYNISNLILKVAVFINPQDSFEYEVLGFNYYKLARRSKNPVYKKAMIEKSFKNYEKSLVYFPNYYQTYNHLGYNYIEIEDFDNALKMFNKSLELKPKNGTALLESAFIQAYVLKENEDALKKLTIYKAENPYDVNVYFSLGWVYDSLNQKKEAISSYEKYLEAYPQNIAALVNISGCENFIGDYEKALKHTNEGLLIRPYAIYLLSHKADALANLGRYKEAKVIIQKEIDKKLFYGEYFFTFKLAKIQKIEGDTENSKKNFEKSKENARNYFDNYCEGKDYNLNDNDDRCHNASVFLKNFEKNKNLKRFVWLSN